MGKKHGAGEGSIYKRADWRWTARLTIGIDAGGKPQVWQGYGKSRREVAAKLAEAIARRERGEFVVTPKTTVDAPDEEKPLET